MDKQNVILKSQVIEDLEVIGQGGMVYQPCQVGDWWVMPADMYTGKIPDNVMEKWSNFKAYAKTFNIPVVGYLILDDMREVLIRREKEAEEQRERERQELERERLELERERQIQIRLSAEQEAERQRREMEWQRRQDAAGKAAEEALVVTGKILTGIAIAAGAVALGAVALPVAALLAILRFDPVLVAVLPDGRWITVASWWD